MQYYVSHRSFAFIYYISDTCLNKFKPKNAINTEMVDVLQKKKTKHSYWDTRRCKFIEDDDSTFAFIVRLFCFFLSWWLIAKNEETEANI